MRTKTIEKEVKVEKEKFNLQDCFVLWRNESKSGAVYLKGHLADNTKVVGFINKEDNEKQPKVKVYSIKEDGALDMELVALWESTSKTGNKYLSGLTNDNEKIIAFYGDIHKEMRPYIKAYYKEN